VQALSACRLSVCPRAIISTFVHTHGAGSSPSKVAGSRSGSSSGACAPSSGHLSKLRRSMRSQSKQQFEAPVEAAEALDARVVFLAKSGPVGRGVRIPGENTQARLAIRYGNGSRGSRPGAPHYSHWLPEVAARVRAFFDTE